MVVARDRYLAEDAADRVRVSYDPLPPGGRGGRRADRATAGARGRARQRRGAPGAGGRATSRPALASSPHTLELDLDRRAQRLHPAGGQGRATPAGTPTSSALRIWSSTQTTTGVRAAVAAKLGLPLANVECIAPDVGGGFGVKIMHPWPEEVLVPWAARELGRDVKWTEDRREHFVSSAHERQQLQHVAGRLRRRGADPRARLQVLARQRRLHAVRHHRADRHLDPGCSARTSPAPTGWSSGPLYTNTVIVTPYRGAGRPQGVFAMERTMDAHRRHAGPGPRPQVRAVNLIQPDEMPYDHGLIFQDGRPLIYDSGDYPASLEKLKKLVGWEEFAGVPRAGRGRGPPGRDRAGLLRRGHRRRARTRAAHVQVETSGRVNVATGLTSQGQGHQTVLAQIVADTLGVPMDDVHVTTGDTRRFGYAVGTFASRAAVMSGNAVAVAAGKVREKALRIAADALEADPADLELVDGVVPGQGCAGRRASRWRRWRCCATRCGTRSTPRPPAATQFAGGGSPDAPPVAEGDEPGLEATGLLLAAAVHVRQRDARGDRGDRSADRRDPGAALLRGARLRHAGQPDDRRRPDPRRGGPGRGRRAVRADGVRRERATGQRLVHGLPDAVRHRGAGRWRPTTCRRRRR